VCETVCNINVDQGAIERLPALVSNQTIRDLLQWLILPNSVWKTSFRRGDEGEAQSDQHGRTDQADALIEIFRVVAGKNVFSSSHIQNSRLNRENGTRMASLYLYANDGDAGK
jgi:hypothetical protein